MRNLIAVVFSVAVILVIRPKTFNNPGRLTFKTEHTKQGMQVKPKQPETAPETVKLAATQPTGCAYYKQLLARYDWNVHVMYGVMRAESNCDPYAVNTRNYDGVYDYGLLQLHGQDIVNPEANIAAAYRLWVVQGYGAWTTYDTGAYLSYE
jgi:hypothetical protein